MLDDVTSANPGIKSLLLDINDRDSIRSFSQQVAQDYPELNVLINNAGIARVEDFQSLPGYLEDAEAIMTTNVLGPIRLTAALLPLLQNQPPSVILTVSSGLAFVPNAATPIYSATKAAIHSYSVSLRHQLKRTITEVIEIIPPYMQTQLSGEHQMTDPHAMPLDEFIAEVMDILANHSTVEEVVVDRCKPLRFAVKNGNADMLFQTHNP